MPIFIDSSRCVGCGACVRACSKLSLSLENEKVRLVPSNCVLCGHCYAICPTGAFSLLGYDPDDVPVDTSRLVDAIAMRRTIRHFKAQPVGRELLQKVINITRYAPSAANKRPVKFMVVGQQTMRQLLPLVVAAQNLNTEDNFYQVFRNAPHMIITHAAKDLKYAAEEDAAIWLTQLELYAMQFGLGTFWAGRVESGIQETGPQVLGIENDKICCCMGIGYPDISYLRPAARADVNDIIFLE